MTERQTPADKSVSMIGELSRKYDITPGEVNYVYAADGFEDMTERAKEVFQAHEPDTEQRTLVEFDGEHE